MNPIAEKCAFALQGGLVVIACIGELLEEREAGKTEEVVREYFNRALCSISLS